MNRTCTFNESYVYTCRTIISELFENTCADVDANQNNLHDHGVKSWHPDFSQILSIY